MENDLQERLAPFNDLTYPELAERLMEADEAYRQAKQVSNDRYEELQFLQRLVIPSRMERDQIQNITVNTSQGNRKLVILSQVSVKTPPDKKEQLWAWLKDNDAEDLISETVNSSTLSAFVREQMKNGEPYPADIVEVTMYDTASLRKA